MACSKTTSKTGAGDRGCRVGSLRDFVGRHLRVAAQVEERDMQAMRLDQGSFQCVLGVHALAERGHRGGVLRQGKQCEKKRMRLWLLALHLAARAWQGRRRGRDTGKKKLF
jgi:hypothetical protein